VALVSRMGGSISAWEVIKDLDKCQISLNKCSHMSSKCLVSLNKSSICLNKSLEAAKSALFSAFLWHFFRKRFYEGRKVTLAV